MKKIFLITVMILAVASCETISPTGYSMRVYQDGFIGSYTEVTEIHDMLIRRPSENAGEYKMEILFIQKVYNYGSKDYLQLRAEYGDSTLKWYFYPWYESAIVNDFQSIDVVCNQDFLGHKAGESLADIVEYNGMTAWPFIKSGYENPKLLLSKKDENGWYSRPLQKGGLPYNNGAWTSINKKLSELTPEDLKLSCTNCMNFTFPRFPDDGKKYKFTFYLRDGRNGTLSQSYFASSTDPDDEWGWESVYVSF